MTKNIHLPMALLVLLAGMVLILALTSRPAQAATTFTVNRGGDGDDKVIDGVCDTSLTSGSQCSLRAAIQEANATPNSEGPDEINFAIGGTANVKTIKVGSSGLGALPTITDPLAIDGYSQGSTTETTSDDAKPNASPTFIGIQYEEGSDAVIKVQLNGTNAGTNANGLRITAPDTTIKGLAVNGFARNGILIRGSGATGNKVEGNFIGTNASGTRDLGNAIDGVRIAGGSDNTVGGSDAAQTNVISGNGSDGVEIKGSGATGNLVARNYIGMDASGSKDLGNSSDGVYIEGAPNNTVGIRSITGPSIGATNLISGNDSDGIAISGSGATGNNVQDNGIGIYFRTIDGGGGFYPAALGNSGHGVYIEGASNNNIGWINIGNEIAHNGGDGVYVGSGSGNRILNNIIRSNGELGIDLGPDGVTNNDVDTTGPNDDADSGANNLQNAPVITSVRVEYDFSNDRFYTVITGTLDSTPNQQFYIEFFETDNDPSNHGEAHQNFTGSQWLVRTDANGHASFEIWVDSPGTSSGLTATATNTSTWDTSEFSENVFMS